MLNMSMEINRANLLESRERCTRCYTAVTPRGPQRRQRGAVVDQIKQHVRTNVMQEEIESQAHTFFNSGQRVYYTVSCQCIK